SVQLHHDPMVGHESWQPSERPPVKPPHVSEDDKKKKGRRLTKRMKGSEENTASSSQPRKHMPNNERVSRRNVTLRCTICRKSGHNRATHKNDHIPLSTPETVTVDHMDHVPIDTMTAQYIQVPTMVADVSSMRL
ncbi:hypothetical protein LINPERPRIM_LOCUS37178, partial [Linum perenne]